MAPSEKELTAIGRTIRELLVAENDAANQLRVVRSQLLERVTIRHASADGWQRLRRTTWRPRWAIVSACLTAAVTGILLLCARMRPISFQVGTSGAPGRLGDVIEATADVPVSLRFSEGSSIVLRDGRARVLATERTGAQILVESGAVHVTITHRDRTTRWRFELGPYRVLVTGTTFNAAWNPRVRTLSVSMTEGAVEVAGGCLEHPRMLRAGEQLQLSCPASAPLAPARSPASEQTLSGSATPSPSPLVPRGRRAGMTRRRTVT